MAPAGLRRWLVWCVPIFICSSCCELGWCWPCPQVSETMSVMGTGAGPEEGAAPGSEACEGGGAPSCHRGWGGARLLDGGSLATQCRVPVFCGRAGRARCPPVYVSRLLAHFSAPRPSCLKALGSERPVLGWRVGPRVCDLVPWSLAAGDAGPHGPGLESAQPYYLDTFVTEDAVFDLYRRVRVSIKVVKPGDRKSVV